MSRRKLKGIGLAISTILSLVVAPQLIIGLLPSQLSSQMAGVMGEYLQLLMVFGVLLAILYIVKYFTEPWRYVNLGCVLIMDVIWLYLLLYIAGFGDPASYGMFVKSFDAVKVSFDLRFIVNFLILIIAVRVVKDMVDFAYSRKIWRRGNAEE